MISLKYSFLIIFVIIFIGVGVGSFITDYVIKTSITVTPTVVPATIPTLAPISDEKLEIVVNNWRQSQNLQLLIRSENLCKIAIVRLSEIKTNWSHDGFNYKRFCANCYLGENLAKDYATEDAILIGWLNSPSHRNNLTTSYTHSCIKTDGNHVVQIFGYF